MTMNKVVVVDEKFCVTEETHLTVHKTSVFFHGDGFIAYDTNGEVLFRFDCYGLDSKPKDELVLMDSSGKCILTLLRKKPSLHQRWEGYAGEKAENQDPIFSVSRLSIIGRSSLVAEVYGDANEEYQIEGSFPQRCSTIYRIYTGSSSRVTVSEIKRKVDHSTHIVLGKDVFVLSLKPGVDSAFAMGLVLILDQLYDDDADDDAEKMGPTLQDSSS